MIDTHAHLDMKPFEKDREEVISCARDAGVKTIITVGTDVASSRKAIEIAESHKGIYAAVGFHPHEAGRFGGMEMAQLEKLAKHPRVVAIGEMGLDLYRDYSPEEAQRQVFKWQLELALRVDKPIIIHCRQAEHEVIPILRKWVFSDKRDNKHPRGVIHCFSGDADSARQYLEMGFYIAFGAYIGYPTSSRLRDVIAIIPADRMVVETDCPFLPPQSRRGKRNEPSYIPLTVEAIALIRRLPPEIVASETTQNASKLFRLVEARKIMSKY